MTFEEYAMDWLERQNFSKNIRKITRQSVDYICQSIGYKEIPEIIDLDVEWEDLFRSVGWMWILTLIELILIAEWRVEGALISLNLSGHRSLLSRSREWRLTF